MSLFPLWRGTIRVPALSPKTKKYGASTLRHTLFESFQAKAEIFDIPQSSYKRIVTNCKPPFNTMLLRPKGVKRIEQEELVLATGGIEDWHKLRVLDDLRLENTGVLEQHTFAPDEICASWAGDFSFNEFAPELDAAGLRRPQIGSLHAISAHFAVGGEFEAATVVLPTGTGKTETMLASLVYRRIPKLLVLVPSDALRNQISKKFENLGILREIGCVVPEAFNPSVLKLKEGIKSLDTLDGILQNTNVIVTLPNTLASCSDAVFEKLCQNCSDLYVDEAHHVSASSWQRVKDQFARRRVVQFTATPFRQDRKHIGGRIIFNYRLSDAQKDGYYKPIRLETVEEFGETETRDYAIAERALEVLRSDISHGHEHFMMARVTGWERAEEVLQIYQKLAPEFHPVAVYTGTGRGPINRNALDSLMSLEPGTSRIVVCVNMLGEGFDLPNLKVAAIHENHKSLAVTLQFVGRFTRKADNVGDAAVVVNIADTNAERSLSDLYAEGADWDRVISRLSENKIQGELQLQEVIEGLKKSGTLHEKLSLWNLSPNLSTQVYKTKCTDWNPLAYAEILKGSGQYWHALSEEDNVLIVVGYLESRVKWGRYESLKESSYELLIAFWDEENKTLFMNSSSYDAMRVGSVAKAVCGDETELLTGDPIFRVLNNVQLPLAKNLGSSRLGAISFTSYFGPNVTEGLASIEKAESALNNIACMGYEDGEKVLWGAAQKKGKIWQQSSGSIDDWMKWCSRTLQKLEDTSEDRSNITVGFLRPQTLKAPYDEHPISIQWGEYLQSSFSNYLSIYFGDVAVPLYMADLRIDGVENDGAILYSVYSENHAAQFRFKIDEKVTNGYFHEPVAGDEIKFQISKERLRDFQEQMVVDPLLIRYVDGTYSYNKFHIPFDLKADDFPSERLEAVDWNGVDLGQESMGKSNKKDTVQYRSFEVLEAEHDVVFNDDGAGEAADLVGLKDVSEDEIRLTLIHCKYASDGKVSGQIANLYEVCGQAQKSIVVKHEGLPKLATSLRKRHEKWAKQGASRLLKGDLKKLSYFVEKSRKAKLSFGVVIVQPSVSEATYSPAMAKLLANTELFLKRTTEADFRFIGS